MPEGEIVVRLFEGAIGPTRLAQATATACLDSQHRLAFDCHLEPAQARQTGHVKLSGSLPLTFTNQPSAVVTYSFSRACMHSLTCLIVHACIHPPTHLSMHPAGWSVHPSTHPSIHPTLSVNLMCFCLESSAHPIAS